MSGEEPATQIAPMESPQKVSTVKLPILKKGEYTLWSMRIEQYLTNIDYSLWQVILNVDGPIQVTTNENGVETEVPPKTAQALLQRQRERKAKSILLLAISDEYQLRFHGIKHAKSLWVAIKKGLDKAYDRFQKLISLLEVHGAAVSNEDANQKFLRGLPSSWNNVALIMRNKASIDDLDINDLYNNLNVFVANIKGSSGSSSNSQNVAFLSTEDTSSSHEVNTANLVSTASGHNSQGQASSSSYIDDLMFSFFANQLNSPQLDDEDLEQIDHDDLEEMDLQWQVAMLSMRVKRFYKKTGRKLIFNGKEPVGFDKTKVECFNCHRKGHFARELETSDALVVQDNALIVQDGLVYDWSYIAPDEPTYAFDSRSSDGDDNQINDRFKKDNGYHAVPPPLTGNYMPLLADLSFARLDDSVYRPIANKTSASVSQVETSTSQTSNTCVEMPRVESVRPSGNTGRREIRPVWNSAPRINHQNKFVPSAVLTRCGRVPVSAAKKSSPRATTSTSTFRPVNITTHTNRVNVSKLKTNAFHKSHSPIRRQTAVSAVKGNRVTAVKASTDLDGGFVAFGGSARGGKITGKGKIRTDKLDFEDVFFVNELKFNLFSILQMCDKKNNVLFTETECLILSFDFKLLDESQVLLRVPRKNNMYNFDLKNVVPSGDLTCLFAKAIINESKLWHRRLVHVNIKTMNKLVKGNLLGLCKHTHFYLLYFDAIKQMFDKDYKQVNDFVPMDTKSSGKKVNCSGKKAENTSAVICLSSKSTAWNEFGTNIASAVICLAKSQKFNFSKLIFDAVFNDEYDTPSHTKKVFANMRRKGKDFSRAVTPLFPSMLGSQVVEGEDEAVHEERGDSVERVAATAASLDAKQDSGGSPRCQEAIRDTIAQTRSERLKKRVKKLERKKKSRTPQPKRKVYKPSVESSEEILGQKDASKQGRNSDKTKELNVDEDEHMFDLSDLAGIEVVLQEESTELVEDEGSAKKGVSVVKDKDSIVDPVTTAGETVTTAGETVTTTSVNPEDSTAIDVSVGSPTRLVNDSTIDDVTLAETLMAIRSSASRPQKLKGVVFKEPSEPTTTSRPQPQI
ncbi:ribonuclease H-like domain-containing protein [Tanacetum coccineum]